jgi:hypothetical protein
MTSSTDGNAEREHQHGQREQFTGTTCGDVIEEARDDSIADDDRERHKARNLDRRQDQRERQIRPGVRPAKQRRQ